MDASWHRRRALGLCGRCEVPSPDRSLCPSHHQRRLASDAKWDATPYTTPEGDPSPASASYQRAWQRKYWDGIFLDVLGAYGGKCVCCGEARTVFLQLDHINGKGAEHKRSLGLSGAAFYRAMQKQGYPPGLQVLCANCHQAKTRKVECPCST